MSLFAGPSTLATWLICLLVPSLLPAQTTRPERTGFRETSSYADVLQFLDSLSRTTTDIRVGTLAVSPQGRRVPYVLAGRPLPLRPSEAHRGGKLIV